MADQLPMRVFDGIVGVSDGQLYVASDPEDIGPDLFAHFSRQANGLLGAATPSLLCLVTGVADGDIGFTVEVCEREPSSCRVWSRPKTPRAG
jgi:hypothetical protein